MLLPNLISPPTKTSLNFKHKKMKKIFLFPIILIATNSLLSSCSHQNNTTAAVAKESIISDSTMQLLTIDSAQLRNVDDEVKLNGEVSFDDNKVVKVFPFSSGQVTNVNVSIGDYVKAGQTLATIKSAEISGNYSDLSIAGNDVNIAKRSMDNAEHLYKNGIASEKEYIEAKENYNKANATNSKIHSQIQINGGGRTTANGTYTVTAPRSGYLVEKLINTGNFIRNDNSSNLFTIGDISDVWIWANVFESDVAKIKVGYAADITTVAYPDSVFVGKVDKINQILDPVTKVMKIKIVLPNKNNMLKPSMFANISISNTENKKMVTIPQTALVNDNQKTYVVAYVNNNNVSIREIKLLKTVNGYAYVKEGLQQGEKVITKNEILIYKKLQDINNGNAVAEK